MAKPKSDKTVADRVFWGSAIAFSIAGLLYLSVYSLVNKSLLVGILAIVFAIMWAGALGLGFYVGKGYDILNYGTLFGNISWFFVGFLVYVGINLFSLNTTGDFSVFTISSNSLYATVSAEIPANIDFIMSVFIIPIVEELLWIFGIPAALFAILNNYKHKLAILGNPIFQIAIITIIAGGTFAFFHVGKVSVIAFVVSAILFRSIMVVSIYSDWAFDFINFFQVTPALALGSHIGNNLASFGISKAYNLIVVNFASTGWIISLVFTVMILILINGIFTKFMEVTKT